MIGAMPTSTEGIPSTIKRSPPKVQRVYEEALDNAHREYDSEERAHRAAWAAVKHVAEKKGDHWELKPEKGPSDPQPARGGAAARRSRRTFGGVNVINPHPRLYEEARRLRLGGPSAVTQA